MNNAPKLHPSVLFPFAMPSLDFSPLRYRAHGVGNWSGHIPFACDLVAVLRPSVFVELGTHLGESYFAFCQAIVESGTHTQAYAVDTWEGDIHTGAYGNEVFREVDEYNRALYNGFSHLMRMSFDEAAGDFENESIDLLHIDGLHTYEAVRHDFDLWWPKVKPGGIVLLHDSAGRHDDFGVWKVLEEARECAQVAEFFHSNGLGVVRKPGPAAETGLLSLLFSDDATLHQLRRYYEICADHLEYKFWSARRKHPADWDITTQLFWRSEGEPFTEAASVRLAHTITAERSCVVLAMPVLSARPVELRLDLAEVPALLKLSAISAVNSTGETLWSIEAATEIDALVRGGLDGVVAGDASGVLILEAPLGSSFTVPIPASALESLAAGGQIVLEMSGLDAVSFASQLAAGSRSGAPHPKLAWLMTAFEEAQRLALERLAELERYDRALAESSAEIERYRHSLADAQAIIASQGHELASRGHELEAAKERIRTLESQLETVTKQREAALARLRRIESSLVWRVGMPVRRIALRLLSMGKLNQDRAGN